MSLSLAERERRAKERSSKGKTSPKPGGGGKADEGGSLFDKYAGLAGRDVDEEAEVAELMEMLGTAPGSQRMSQRHMTGREEYFREAGWDPSPHRNPPAALKQIKPQTREPWAIDADVYNKGKYATDTSDFAQPERYGIDLVENLQTRGYRPDKVDQRVRAKPGKAKPAPAWNSQPFRSVPYSLRGIKPAPGATEPWVADHQNRKGDFEDSDVIENQTAIELDNGGDQIFKNKKKDAWDSTTRTPWRADGRHGRVRGIN